MASSFANLKELHCLTLPNQANVYSMAILNGFLDVKPCGTVLSDLEQTLMRDKANIIVAALRKPVYLFNFGSSRVKPNEPIPIQHEIPFTYIPSQAEIIAIDAFQRFSGDNHVSTIIIGVAIIKSDDGGSFSQYLNIYSDFDLADRDAKLEPWALNCFSIQLDFVPYHLYHCDLPHVREVSEIVWLISGSDERVHLFVENSEDHTFGEVSVGSFFPELDRVFPSIVLRIDVSYDEMRERRLTGCGCECGSLFVFVVASKTREVLSAFSEDFSSPVTSMKFFHTESRRLPVPDVLRGSLPDLAEGRQCGINLLVTLSGSTSLVFRNVEEGLSTSQKLLSSDSFDIATCGCICDISMDGVHEIILGTYGQVILCYKLNSFDTWELTWKKTWSSPILAIHYCDMTGDGVRELVVLTTNGVQILQHDPDAICKIVMDRMLEIRRSSKTSYQETS